MLYVYDVVNDVASYLRDVVMWRDPAVSLKLCGLIYAATYVASWLSFALLSFTVMWVLMCGSIVKDLVYEQYVAPVVEPQISCMKDKLAEILDKVPKMKSIHKVD